MNEQAETGQLADPARFPSELQSRLLAIGWTPGRDVSDAVGQWLSQELPRLREFEFAGRDRKSVV